MNNKLKLILIIAICWFVLPVWAGIEDDFIKIKSSDLDEKLIAAQNLKNYKSDERAKIALVEALKDENSGARITVINSLSRFHDKNLADKFIEIAENDENIAVRKAAIQALSRYTDKKVLDFLQNVLAGKENRIRRNAAKALGWIGTERSTEILLTVCDDKDEKVQETVVKNLGRRILEGYSGKHRAKLLKLMKKKAKSKNPKIRAKAEKVMKEIKSKK